MFSDANHTQDTSPPPPGYCLCPKTRSLWPAHLPLACQKADYKTNPGAQQIGPGDWEAGGKRRPAPNGPSAPVLSCRSICTPKSKATWLTDSTSPNLLWTVDLRTNKWTLRGKPGTFFLPASAESRGPGKILMALPSTSCSSSSFSVQFPC